MSGARVLAFSSAKGGSGKTITCISFARVLAALGKNVLVLDADADTSGMTLFFIDDVLREKESLIEQAGTATHQGLFEHREAAGYTVAHLDGGFDLVPTQYELAPLTSRQADFDGRLRAVVASALDRYDFILLDAQAGADPLALAAAAVAHEVVIVSEYDPVSAQGVKRLERLHPDIFSPGRTWILYNKVLPDIVTSVGTLLRVERHLAPIPWDAEVVWAYVSGTVPVNMEAPNSYTLAVVASIETLFQRRLVEELRNWRTSAADVLRAPIDQRLHELEMQLDDVERQRIEIRTLADLHERRARALRFGATFIVLAMTLGVAVSFRDLGIQATVGAFALLAALVAVATQLSTARASPRRAESELQLARLERQYASLEDERRRLATSAASVASQLGISPPP